MFLWFVRSIEHMPLLTRIFHSLGSRRREGEGRARICNVPPPHVGGYNLSAFHAGYEISELSEVHQYVGWKLLRTGRSKRSFCTASRMGNVLSNFATKPKPSLPRPS